MIFVFFLQMFDSVKFPYSGVTAMFVHAWSYSADANISYYSLVVPHVDLMVYVIASYS